MNRFNIGGPIWNASYLTSYLSEAFETKLIGGPASKEEGDATFILKEFNIEAIEIPEMKRNVSVFGDFISFFKIIKIILKYKPDIVHTHAAKAGAIGRVAAFICRVPVRIHTFHGHVFANYFSDFTTKIIIKIERFLAKISTCIIAISETQKEDLVLKYKICSDSKIAIIPLGFNLEKFILSRDKRDELRKTMGLTDLDKSIAIVGRLTPIKNHKFFIDCAFKILESQNSNYQFYIVGDGELKEELESYIKTNHLIYLQNFHFLGWIQDMSTFYPAMDIVCLCSFNEGTPVSLIEAQATGIPVISTNVGGVSDVVSNGESGYITQQGVTNDFVNLILKVCTDEKIYSEMSQNAISNVEAKFSYKRLVSDMENLYLKLLNYNEA